MSETAAFQISMFSSYKEITPEVWEACVDSKKHPFLSHAFFSSLEDSMCIGAKTGWYPAPVVVRDENDKICAFTPSFMKGHSQGEYVFDQIFANAMQRAGGAYYPKLQISVPFTPATGPRLLIDRHTSDAQRSALYNILIAGIAGAEQASQASSTHFTFLENAEATRLEAAGYLMRHDQQYHFLNKGYADFEAFLETLTARKRKMIRRERKDALANDITIEWVQGRDITEAHWDAFFSFYQDTGSRKWGRPYLNRTFFSMIGARMASQILLIMAKREGRYIAGAINFIGEETLFGRNWGCIEEHPFLHFEVCYYQAMDYALQHNLRCVEAGAQGEHKLLRGYEPILTTSAHHFVNPSLQKGAEDYLRRERKAVLAGQIELAAHLPFKAVSPQLETTSIDQERPA